METRTARQTLKQWAGGVLGVVIFIALIGLIWVGWPWIGAFLGWLTGQTRATEVRQLTNEDCSLVFNDCRQTCLAMDPDGLPHLPPHRRQGCMKDCVWEYTKCQRAVQQQKQQQQ